MSETAKCGGNALVNYWCVECGSASGTLVLNGRVAGWAHVDKCPVPAATPAPRAPTFDATLNCPTHFVKADPSCDACQSKQIRATGEGEAPTNAPDSYWTARQMLDGPMDGFSCEAWYGALADLVKDIPAALTERATIVEAARKFVPTARHSIGCSLVPCDCGLNEMVAALRASLKETTNG